MSERNSQSGGVEDRRRPRGNECECMGCGRFFTSPSAFDLHLTRFGCQDPAEVRNKKGEWLMTLHHRGRGPTWAAAGNAEWTPGR